MRSQDLQYRFTGKDSRLLCHNFMRLIKWLSSDNDSHQQRKTVLIFAYLGLRLRDCVSLFSRFDITVEQVTKQSISAHEYYHVNAMFLPTSVNTTKLSENTFYKRRWYEIFKHEFVMSVRLPEQGFNLNTYKDTDAYIPDRVFSDPRFCYCNLEKASPTDGKCTFCGDPIMKFIQQSVELGKVLPQMLGDTRP